MGAGGRQKEKDASGDVKMLGGSVVAGAGRQTHSSNNNLIIVDGGRGRGRNCPCRLRPRAV